MAGKRDGIALASGGTPTLIGFVIGEANPEIRRAPLDRAWMDATADRFAYRCLPLTIANAHGWEILCPSAVTAIWDGDASQAGIRITSDDEKCPAISHFGNGILTFSVPILFRTSPEIDLLVQGPVNIPKDGIAPLSGIVETDWSPFTFTMNWKFTRAWHRISFARGEPFCCIMPLKRGLLEQIEPQLKRIDDDPELKREYDAWNDSRKQFNRDLKIAGTEAQARRWQKNYHRGVNIAGKAFTKSHKTKLTPREFVRSDRGDQDQEN